MAPTRWAAGSVDKHGIDRADTLHAMRNARLKLDRFSEARVEGATDATLWIGPTRDGTRLLEVLAHLDQAAQDVFIFHVMPLRRSTVERARRVMEERRNKP